MSNQITSHTINQITLVGRVGRDPESYKLAPDYTEDLAAFTLATSEPGDDPDITRIHWHRITAAGALAAHTCEHVKKGDLVFVQGRLEYDTYQRDGVVIPCATIVPLSVRVLARLTPAPAGRASV